MNDTTNATDGHDGLKETRTSPGSTGTPDEPQEDDQPPSVLVPIRPGAGPFDPPEYGYVEPQAAGHWSTTVWNREPPR